MKNIIFILIDGARHDFISKNEKYKKLFKSSKWFNNVYSASPYTIGSMHAIFTGMYAKNNGVNGYFRPNDLKKDVKIIPQYLKEKGYCTLCNIPSPVVMADRGFDLYALHDEYNKNIFEEQFNFVKDNADSMKKKSPFFLYLHYSKIHTSLVENVLRKYDDRSNEYFEHIEQNRLRYEKDIDISGDYLTEMFELFDTNGLTENTDIWILSDHGASIGEKFGERAYGVFLYNYTLHTFLINYKNEGAREDDDSIHSTVDVLPLIFQNNGIEYAGNIDGRLSREKESKGFMGIKKVYDDIYFETGGVDGPYPSPEKHNIFGIMNGFRKLVHIRAIDKFEEFKVVNGDDISQSKTDNNLRKKLLEYENGAK